MEWRNQQGQVVRETACGLTVVNADGSRALTPARMVVQTPPNLEGEVRRELGKKGNERVIASVDTDRGVVRTFLAPRPPEVITPGPPQTPAQKMGK